MKGSATWALDALADIQTGILRTEYRIGAPSIRIMAKYSRCTFDSQSLMQIPEIGDNFVTSLTVLIEKHELKLTTDGKMGEGFETQTELLFTGVVAHYFDHVADPSIIFGIEESDLKDIYDKWEHVFVNGRNYGWPIKIKEKRI